MRRLLAIEPAGDLDAHDVLRAARRSRSRRRAWLSVGAVAAAGAVAFAVLALPGGKQSVSPSDERPAPGPTTRPIRSFDGEPTTAFVLGSYADPESGERREAVALFTVQDRRSRVQVLLLCGGGLTSDGRLLDFGACTGGPALPKEGRYGGAVGASLHFAIDAPATALGERFQYMVVGHEVARGWVFDEAGVLHEGRVIGDPSMPARLLVVDDGGRYLSGYRLEDANGRVLEERHGPDEPVVTPSG